MVSNVQDNCRVAASLIKFRDIHSDNFVVVWVGKNDPKVRYTIYCRRSGDVESISGTNQAFLSRRMGERGKNQLLLNTLGLVRSSECNLLPDDPLAGFRVFQLACFDLF